MKKSISLLVACLAILMPTHPPKAFAAPFLVCTPIATGLGTTPSSYTVTGLGSSAISSPAVTITAGTVQLHLDLGVAGQNLANGNYTVTATATNSAGTSAASGPFTFSLPLLSAPAAPAGLSLSPN